MGLNQGDLGGGIAQKVLSLLAEGEGMGLAQPDMVGRGRGQELKGEGYEGRNSMVTDSRGGHWGEYYPGTDQTDSSCKREPLHPDPPICLLGPTPLTAARTLCGPGSVPRSL